MEPLSVLQSSRFSLEYLLLPPRSEPAEAPVGFAPFPDLLRSPPRPSYSVLFTTSTRDFQRTGSSIPAILNLWSTEPFLVTRYSESFTISKNLPTPVTSIICCISDQLYCDTTLFLFFNKPSRTFELFIYDGDYILCDVLDICYIIYSIIVC
ncbi:hypothetical protein TNCT_433981 [Trichonephila clavata]|uniref:Uncharacterized protein n=1 Tax=Trichonephila clavata TaxID=2740835 RepID=A0A8X6HSI2_TRICU|nr:hypothetical protein TNCT_433981 [Trichonephila clavata]